MGSFISRLIATLVTALVGLIVMVAVPTGAWTWGVGVAAGIAILAEQISGIVKRDEHTITKHFAWRALDGSPLDDYHGDLDLKTYDNTTGTATACFTDQPEICGTMWGVPEGCGGWVGLTILSDDDVNVHPFNPNGTMYSMNPMGTKGTQGKWILSVGAEDVLYCAEHLPNRTTRSTGFSGWYMDFYHNPSDLDSWDGTKRSVSETDSISGAMELDKWFAVLPHAGILNDHVAKGASIMHRHMGNYSAAQTVTLYHTFSHILEKAQRRNLAWSLVRRGSMSPDLVIDALRKAVIDSAYEEDRKWLEVFSNGAMMKAVGKRAHAGKAGRADERVMASVFDRVHGPIERVGLMERLRRRLPGAS